MVKIAPSILSADFSRLGDQVREVTLAGVDYVHIDIMDGYFVPNLTIGAAVVASIRKITNLPLDVHLMVEKPDSMIEQFSEAGANIITVHVETCTHLHRTISQIKKYGVRAGIALNPATPLCLVSEILDFIDLLLVMTVNPGFGGQSFILEMLPKIKEFRKEINAQNRKIELEVDGGINQVTAPDVVKAGADTLIAGTAIFNSNNKIADMILKLREAGS